MKVEILSVRQMDRDSHSKLIRESLEYSPLFANPQAEDIINSHLQKIISHPDSYVMIVATDKETGQLLGQLLIRLNFGDIGLIQAWQPIVLPDAYRTEIAIALINKSKEVVKSHNKSKMEIRMDLANDHVNSIYLTYKNWYERCGFHLSSDEYNMEASFSELNSIQYSIPDYIEIVPMNSIPIEQLREAVFEAFKESKDQWVNNLSEDEIRSIIKTWMKVEEIFHPKASIVLMENGKIIGFNGMEIQEHSIEVGPLGVLHSHRGNGLGRLMLLESIKRTQSEPEKKVILSVSTGKCTCSQSIF
ncbi:MAG: GNAT family N-acetyltransferase [Promethearchaeota archaeon]